MKMLSGLVLGVGLICASVCKAQWVDLSGSTPYIRQYVEENEDNWNKSIIYVFYNNEPCEHCDEAMGLLYDIYQQDYSNQFSYFEINYQEQGEFVFSTAYMLEQPLSVVLVKINDGMSRGYYKIENPQQWLDNKQFFVQQITTAINNFLVN